MCFKGNVFKISDIIFNVLVEKHKVESIVTYSPNMYLARVGMLLSEIKKTGSKQDIVQYLKIASQYAWLLKLDICQELSNTKASVTCTCECGFSGFDELNGFVFCNSCGLETGEMVQRKGDWHCLPDPLVVKKSKKVKKVQKKTEEKQELLENPFKKESRRVF